MDRSSIHLLLYILLLVVFLLIEYQYGMEYLETDVKYTLDDM